jgi:hypothetical protein
MAAQGKAEAIDSPRWLSTADQLLSWYTALDSACTRTGFAVPHLRLTKERPLHTRGYSVRPDAHRLLVIVGVLFRAAGAYQTTYGAQKSLI